MRGFWNIFFSLIVNTIARRIRSRVRALTIENVGPTNKGPTARFYTSLG